MNYLAHTFLSGKDPETIIGNFIADAVKGNRHLHYPEKVGRGIRLHRFIDSFTDHHEIVEKSKQRLRERFGKFSGVIVDVFYDHFLAGNFETFSDVPLKTYTTDIYGLLLSEAGSFPEKIQYMLPYMAKQDWLFHYGSIDGTRKALTGMAKRTSFVSNMEFATEALVEHYDSFKNEFFEFFPVLMGASGKFLRQEGQ